MLRKMAGIRNAVAHPRAWLIALAIATGISGSVDHASAQQSNIIIPGDDDSPPPCAPNFASLTATQKTLTPGQSTTLAWTVQVPSGCAMPMLYLRNTATSQSIPVNAVDGMTVTPFMTTTYTVGTLQLNLRQVTITVTQPTGPNGAPVVTITANNQKALLVQTLGIPYATVNVQDHVEMDLSAYTSAIQIANGVQFKGGRTGRQPGARLYVRPDAAPDVVAQQRRQSPLGPYQVFGTDGVRGVAGGSYRRRQV